MNNIITELKTKIDNDSNSIQSSIYQRLDYNYVLFNEQFNNLKLSGEWQMIDSVLCRDFGTSASKKIMALDLDGTLIITKSGNTFPKNENDWMLLNKNIPEILQKYLKNGYKIIIFSNQAGISRGHTDMTEWKNKLSALQRELNLPIQVFAATKIDYYRKPSVGMWELMLRFNEFDVDLKESLFVGDAAGRPESNQRFKKDFSDFDYKFAKNIGIEFKTPEIFFDDSLEILPEINFNPRSLDKDLSLFKNITTNCEDKLKSSSTEIIVLIGSPGTGKSTFYNNYLKPNGYIEFDKHSIISKKNYSMLFEEEVKKGNSLVVYCSNPSVDAKLNYINLAKRLGVEIRTFVFNFKKELVFHLNDMRLFNIHRNHYSEYVDDKKIDNWFEKFVQPTIFDGFKEILDVNFIPGPFENSEDEKAFYSYT